MSACAAAESIEEEEEEEEDLGVSSSAVTTVTTHRYSIPNSSCNTNTSTVLVGINAAYTTNPDNLAPWKALSVAGTFQLGTGAIGVQIRYWIDDNSAYSQTDGVAMDAASGTWSWTYNNITCNPHKFTVCAIPYVYASSYASSYGSACGELTAPYSAGYRNCQTLNFRGCSKAVGVIPDFNTACPANADIVDRNMDDEDDNNNTSASGWIACCSSRITRCPRASSAAGRSSASSSTP